MGKKGSKYYVILAIFRLNFDQAVASLQAIYCKLNIFGCRSWSAGACGAFRSSFFKSKNALKL
jgi:hypothetical protein